MPYTPPAGTVANFAIGYLEFPRPYNGLNFKYPVGTYTPPAGNNVQAQFPTPPADWVAPLGSAANFQTLDLLAYVANGAVTVGVVVEGHGTYTQPANYGGGAAAVDVVAEGHGKHGVAGFGAATVEVTTEQHGKHGVAGHAANEIPIAVAGVGLVERYEVSGEVRLQGVLVNRTVRAYRRDTGILVGEALTVNGKFKVHTGFTQFECYVVPVDLAVNAEDWAPPCANRLVPVLAQDSA